MPSKKFIVAIELGSTKITGIAGLKNSDGSFTVNAIARENSTSCIRKGVVYNSDKTVQCIKNIISRLRTTMKTEIAQVYVGVGGQSIHSERNVIVKDMVESSNVTQKHVVELMDSNRAMEYKDCEILDVVTQEYKVGAQYQLEPVGIECSHLEGNFLNILQRRKHYHNLNNCFEKAGVKIAEMYLAPFALADAVLEPAEKLRGCVLVDLGAETTTVLVYHKNVLRHIAVIPLGGNNITKDIASIPLDEAEAEKLKLRYASAYTEVSEIDSSKTYNIDKDREIECSKFIDLVEGRVQEIVQNVWYQVPNEFADKLVGGIILTGGGSNLKNIITAFRNHTHIDKVRVAQYVHYTIHSSSNEITAHNGQMNTILGLLAKGELNCAGEDIIEQKSIFEDETPATAEPEKEEIKTVSFTSEPGKGKVATLKELEAAKKQEPEPVETKEEEVKEEEKKPSKPGIGNKVKKWLMGLITEE